MDPWGQLHAEYVLVSMPHGEWADIAARCQPCGIDPPYEVAIYSCWVNRVVIF